MTEVITCAYVVGWDADGSLLVDAVSVLPGVADAPVRPVRAG
ncbi:hypothetical protein [Streptomyces inhibens]|nr:hypothetical protein [Streptomyces inhibens]